MTASRERDANIEEQSTEAVPQREMMSILSGSTASILPTTDGAAAADSAADAAGSSTQEADTLPLPDSDAEGSSSQQAISSDEDVSTSIHQNDSASSET